MVAHLTYEWYAQCTMHEFDEFSIFNFLKQINPNKSRGRDYIGGLIIKNCFQSISLPLSMLFNIIYRTGIIPAEWKIANIVPVHIKGDKNFINNYRPISLTGIISKVFENVSEMNYFPIVKIYCMIVIMVFSLINLVQHNYYPFLMISHFA